MIRHRNKVLWLNAELFVLRGLPHIFTTVALESLIGGGKWSTQAIRQDAWRFAAIGQIGFKGKGARINWMLANGEDDTRSLQLLDHLVFEAGIHSSEYVLADINANHPTFELLRQAGFCTCGWGQVWRMDSEKVPQDSRTLIWSAPSTYDGIDLLKLQRQLLPPAVQAVSRLADDRLPDFILRQDGRITAYADCVVFGEKVMVCLTHAACEPDPGQLLRALFQKHFPGTPGQYIMQRGDQVLLQNALTDCADLVMPRFERLVKYLTVPLKVPVGASAAVKNRHHADPVTPILKSSRRQNNL